MKVYHGFTIGETVKIIADWLPTEVKRKRVQIIRFQDHSTNGEPPFIFAKILWKGRTTVGYEALYGDLFSIDELKKV